MAQLWSKDALDKPRPPDFVSLGMVVLDEIRFPERTLTDVPGGSGLYATLGARLGASYSPAGPGAVGYLSLVGKDFSDSIEDQVQSWEIMLDLQRLPDSPTTRGLLEYEDNVFGRKSFRYLTPVLQPLPSGLAASAQHPLIEARSFHFLALPQDLERHVDPLLSLRRERGIRERPLVVWEPAPLGCKRSNLDAHLRACRLVDVFSPNHLELGYLVREHGDAATGSSSSSTFSHEATVEDAGRFLAATRGGPAGMVVVRCGEHGCVTMSQGAAGASAEWLPPYHDAGCSAVAVVDPTGAGNAFLGGFALGLLETGDSRQAAVRGSVSASFALEQFGLPKLAPATADSPERWNGAVFHSRLVEFEARVRNASEDCKTT
ncbi:hypothetical protein RB600_008749 [Gaeumannomyces tritici]